MVKIWRDRWIYMYNMLIKWELRGYARIDWFDVTFFLFRLAGLCSSLIFCSLTLGMKQAHHRNGKSIHVYLMSLFCCSILLFLMRCRIDNKHCLKRTFYRFSYVCSRSFSDSFLLLAKLNVTFRFNHHENKAIGIERKIEGQMR